MVRKPSDLSLTRLTRRTREPVIEREPEAAAPVNSAPSIGGLVAKAAEIGVSAAILAAVLLLATGHGLQRHRTQDEGSLDSRTTGSIGWRLRPTSAE